MKFTVEGDTAHLFAEEDFSKKKVNLLRPDLKENQSNLSVNATSHTETVSNDSKKRITNPDCTRSEHNKRLDKNQVQLVNGSYLTRLLSNANSSDCFFVLFYVPWCPYSAKLAPIFNALPRAFPHLDILAFDLSKSIGYNAKFGASAVPMIMLFQNKNVLVRFNYTEKSVKDYVEFLANSTGFKATTSDLLLLDSDFEGPVSSRVEKHFDFQLLFSWLFVAIGLGDFLLRKTRLSEILVENARKVKAFFVQPHILQLPQPPNVQMIEQNRQNHPHSD